MKLPRQSPSRQDQLLQDMTWIPQYSRDWRSKPDAPSAQGVSILTDPEAFRLYPDEIEMMKSGAGIHEIMFRRLLMNKENPLERPNR